ncbi:ATP-dependent metallopeptidase FtsH/Yme1/Tma family protein [Rickettsiales endosymbiont of Peranema trichophorum]|uniref:ATP-dependent zinc metalloprotease FtsH n=1 Tax=Rickettsiales endosymbiont of Peranema trichophorum TaxID=2486577 RepID=UPI001023C734|nr:ATP-dependent zinc metalloprotease FtsH [Rickettsiales endosymbiont of Peranema trichophorum]RZI47311.1 ATP-dependent metallopeptidase FtsH/Yme1/Tma family protein [Rickettsiales endosymbiont of Peranema trichophorum]
MKQLNNNSIWKNFFWWITIVTLVLFLYGMLGSFNVMTTKITFSDFLDNIQTNNIKEVTIKGDTVEGVLEDGKGFHTLVPANYPELITELRSKNVKINVVPLETSMSLLFGVLISWLPIVLSIALWAYFMRNLYGGGNKAMGFGKSKAKLILDDKNKITFLNVAGVDEAKEELCEIVEFLKAPSKFQKLGGKIPKGCLLIGAPGTGKTLLAKAIAGEASVPFFTISGSDFVEMFVGVGASRVRDMFNQAKKSSPCIVFIDEIDSVGRRRGAGGNFGGGHDEREQTLNQLLVEMDGFNDNDGVIIIAATNRPDVLDPALLRPGRFDRQIHVPIPDINGREQILKVHVTGVPVAPNVTLRTIARGTPGFAGADLKNVINEAALLAARRNMKVVTMRELEEARDKVMMGMERRSLIMSEEEKKLTAYHEGGHAIVSIYTTGSDPIHKVTIIPRGRALGMVMHLPEDDRFSWTKERMLASITVNMGGRIAEELIFGLDKVTSGATSDIKNATALARKMVTEWGLSEKIGPILIHNEKDEGNMFAQNHISEDLACTIDAEIKEIVMNCYERAHQILTTHMKDLHLLAGKLLEYETLTGEEIKDLLSGKEIIRVTDDSTNSTQSRSTRSSSVPITSTDAVLSTIVETKTSH